MINKDKISQADCKLLADLTRPRFEAKSPLDQLCNALLAGANVFLRTVLKKMSEEDRS